LVCWRWQKEIELGNTRKKIDKNRHCGVRSMMAKVPWSGAWLTIRILWLRIDWGNLSEVRRQRGYDITLIFPATDGLACRAKSKGITIDVGAYYSIPPDEFSFRRYSWTCGIQTRKHGDWSCLLSQVCHILIDARKSNRAELIGISLLPNLLRNLSCSPSPIKQDGFCVELWEDI